jgi:hypothetical protein
MFSFFFKISSSIFGIGHQSVGLMIESDLTIAFKA